MRQQPVIITLGVIQIIILTLFGMYFYRLKHSISQKGSKVNESPLQITPIQQEEKL